MTANGTRSEILARALRAGVEGDLAAVRELCTTDVRVWTPRLTASTVEELLLKLERREVVFADFELTVFPLDVGGDFACVEWTVSMTHVGRLQIDDVTSVEPTGLRVTAIGATVAEFVGLQICALRQYWDEGMLLVQLGVGELRGAIPG